MKFYFVNSYAQQTLITFIKKQTLITIYNILKLVYYPTQRLLIKKIKIRLLNRCPMPHVWLKKREIFTPCCLEYASVMVF